MKTTGREAYYRGFLEACFYAKDLYKPLVLRVSAKDDVYAMEPPDPHFDPRELVHALNYMDDEGPIWAMQIKVRLVGGGLPYYEILLWCTEDDLGVPDEIEVMHNMTEAEAAYKEVWG